MLDNKTISDLIEQQISLSVDNQISLVMNDQTWLQEIEAKIVSHIQDRITGRFTNLGSMPDLVELIKQSTAKLIQDGAVPGIDKFVEPGLITRAVDSAVQHMIRCTIDDLMLDTVWLDKIETLTRQAMLQKVTESIRSMDINAAIVNEIEQGITRWQDRFLQEIHTHGLDDQATEVQLTITDQGISVLGSVTATEAMINNDVTVQGTMVVNNLVVKGCVNTDNTSWDELATTISNQASAAFTKQWRQDLVKEVLDIARTQGIDFASVTIDGTALVEGNRLSSTITQSNIQTLGTLSELRVVGRASIAECVTVDNRRLGINTDSPEMALAVWDEEVALLAGKFAKNTAYVGTARNQSLSLGVNRVPQITIDDQGLTTIRQLRVDRFRISHAASVPGYAGTRGDLVFNSDPKPESPFAWVCLGSFRWQPLKSAA